MTQPDPEDPLKDRYGDYPMVQVGPGTGAAPWCRELPHNSIGTEAVTSAVKQAPVLPAGSVTDRRCWGVGVPPQGAPPKLGAAGVLCASTRRGCDGSSGHCCRTFLGKNKKVPI